MHAMVQDKDNDYEVVFLKKDLVGSQGTYKTGLDTRKIVQVALDDIHSQRILKY